MVCTSNRSLRINKSWLRYEGTTKRLGAAGMPSWYIIYDRSVFQSPDGSSTSHNSARALMQSFHELKRWTAKNNFISGKHFEPLPSRSIARIRQLLLFSVLRSDSAAEALTDNSIVEAS